jgi:hypothetical protein
MVLIVLWMNLFLGLQEVALGGSCPALQRSQVIQEQFQLLQHSTNQLNEPQQESILKLLDANKAVLESTRCYIENSKEISQLNDFLSTLKLQILDLRYQIYISNPQKIEARLNDLGLLTTALLARYNYLSRRLGASVRSLLLDELERMNLTYSVEVQKLIDKARWIPNISQDLQSQYKENFLQLRKQFGQLRAPKKLAHFFGLRAWKPASETRSKLAQLLTDLRFQKTATLEAQLLELFSSNKSNLQWQASERNVQYYLDYVSSQLAASPFLAVRGMIQPVIEKHLEALKVELGASWSLIAPLAGINLEGPLEEVNQPIELLDPLRLKQAISHYQTVKNPLGRLYEIVLLKQMVQMWSEVDVVQLQTDLNRVGLLRTSLAMNSFKQKFNKWPKDIQELVDKSLLSSIPKDYFSGQEFKYNSDEKRIWSIGENKNDESGKGDDISLPLTL